MILYSMVLPIRSKTQERNNLLPSNITLASDWVSKLKSKIDVNSQNIKTERHLLAITAHIILKLKGSYKVKHPKQKSH